MHDINGKDFYFCSLNFRICYVTAVAGPPTVIQNMWVRNCSLPRMRIAIVNDRLERPN